MCEVIVYEIKIWEKYKYISVYLIDIIEICLYRPFYYIFWLEMLWDNSKHLIVSSIKPQDTDILSIHKS